MMVLVMLMIQLSLLVDFNSVNSYLISNFMVTISYLLMIFTHSLKKLAALDLPRSY